MFYFYLNDDLFLSITFYFARIWSDHIQRSTFCHLQIILISVWIHLELKTAVECIQKKDKCVVTLDWDSFWSLLVTVSSTIVVLLNEEVATLGWLTAIGDFSQHERDLFGNTHWIDQYPEVQGTQWRLKKENYRFTPAGKVISKQLQIPGSSVTWLCHQFAEVWKKTCTVTLMLEENA